MTFTTSDIVAIAIAIGIWCIFLFGIDVV